MITVEASGVRGDGGHHRAGDSRMEADALMRRSSVRRNGRKANWRGHVSSYDRPRVKWLGL
jgi:hypothetical protein